MVEPITITLRNTARSYLEIIFHRKWLLIIPAVFVTLLAWLYSYTITPMYKSNAVIQVTEKSKENPFIKGFSQSTPISARIGDILEKIRSRSMIEDIIDELNLDKNTKSRLEKRQLVETLRENIEVTITRKNQLLQISCSYPEPEACQKIVNLLTREVIKRNLELQQKETETGIEWLDQELERYKQKMEEADLRLQEFQEKYTELLPEEISNRLYSSVSFKGPQTPEAITPPFGPQYFRDLGAAAHNIYSSRYQNYSSMLLDLGVQFKELQKRKATILRQLENEDEFIIGERIAETNPVIQSLRNEIIQKQVKLAKLKVDSTEEHPIVQRLSQEIKNLNDSIKNVKQQSIREETTVINPIYQSLKTELLKINQEIDALNDRIQRTKTLADAAHERMKEIPLRKKELADLRRNTINYSEIYSRLLKERETAYVTRRLELEERGTKFQIIDNAEIPLSPFKPKRKLIVLAGFFFGLVVGGGLIVLAETTDHSFEEPNQLREFLPVPMLGATSQILTPEEKSFINAKRRLALMAFVVLVTIFILTVGIIMIFGSA